MELTANSIVKNRRGNVGVVMSFNKQPSLVVFSAFVTQLNKYDENGKAKNHEYDIIEVRDGKKVKNYKAVYNKTFKLEDCPLIWEGK